jgi:hypothetical protein
MTLFFHLIFSNNNKDECGKIVKKICEIKKRPKL